MSILKVARSAITGRFVSWWYARTHPKQTVIETIDTGDDTEQSEG